MFRVFLFCQITPHGTCLISLPEVSEPEFERKAKAAVAGTAYGQLLWLGMF
jgi:hypothetical protein